MATEPVPTKEVFENPLGRMVMAIDPFTEADPVGVLGSLLSLFSSYIGNGPKVRTGRGLQSLPVWTVLVGGTGEGRKGTATDFAVKLVEAGLSKWAETGTRHDIPATGLGFANMLAERAGEDESPAPLTMIHTELDTFVGAAKKDPKVGGYLRDAWDNKPIVHKTAKDDIHVRDPHVAIIGHVQPRNWGAILGSRDATGGTYNRFLALYVKISKRLPVFGVVDFEPTLREQGSKLRLIGSWAREVEEITVTPESAEWFEEITRPQIEALTGGTEELRQMTERSLAYVIRIAALYALANMRETIEPEDFDSALALVAYSVESVRFIFPEAGGEALVTKIKTHLMAAPDGLTKAELWHLVGHGVKKIDLDTAIMGLPQVEMTTGPSTGGRPPQIYRWNPENQRERVPA
jgi:hypothetical protein